MTPWTQQLLLVMAGGAIGAAGRFWLGGTLLERFGDGIPWGTLAANLAGAFLAGALVVWLEGRGPSAPYWRAFLIIGLLGGLTTFSTLMLEVLVMARTPRHDLTIAYLGGTLVAGLCLVWMGARVGAWLRAI